MIFKKKKKEPVIDPTKPLYEGDYCHPQCPFLVAPLNDKREFDYSKMYKCSKYNVELNYYNWVLTADECYKEHIDPRGRG